MTKIKICGLTRQEDIEAVNRYLPDYIGCVFVSKSRRFLEPGRSAVLKEQLSPKIRAVGVFANEDKELIADLIKQRVIDMAQLHGQEDEDEIRWIQAKTGQPVIKAVSVKGRPDLVRSVGSCADFLLFDHGTGGTGSTFDWNLLSGCVKPYFLAGGVHIGNLPEALSKGAYAVDISSGVETDGRKDARKIEAVINKIRALSTDYVKVQNMPE